ncbi:MAG: hypothetical protein CVV64_10760 [Candidatus Wallbacteria bacterium HGW-Wallbacteria-1]|jgi:4-hydroxy-3-methylbut-2-enyl diphosphate reductase|uniref:4-hydroxy-3-methylbut-2-enyl diphosphate reductase n=1 Tax=Candidatus Wallbacteria bacterium HGW-Wallbacteria-1 TaxID=2013854 RepID=A0A2N1PPE2_9BACT|nr:MAG: hypothetical protein CVV64_10760 [Candidatus Wallbacteria bacterium HGW-Wallbacteria-1]
MAFNVSKLKSILFTDTDVSLAVKSAHGKLLYIGNTTVMLPEVFGFCRGVTRALALAMEAMNSTSGKIILLGEIIHNPFVNKRLMEAGVTIPDEADFKEIIRNSSNTDTIIIPAFGIEKNLEEQLQTHCKARVVDATCEDVKRIWTFVSSEKDLGRTIVLFGKPSHSEIKATLSRSLGHNCVIIIPKVASAEKLSRELTETASNKSVSLHPSKSTDPEKNGGIAVFNGHLMNPAALSLASQTTMLHSETLELTEILTDLSLAAGGTLHSCSTICRATQQRQDAALELCRENSPDLVIVIGGYDSSNTANLFRIVRSLQKSIFIEGAHCLSESHLSHHDPDSNETLIDEEMNWSEFKRIALLAGASCPSAVIGEVIRRLRQLLPH